jgi:hypothetical protein
MVEEGLSATAPVGFTDIGRALEEVNGGADALAKQARIEMKQGWWFRDDFGEVRMSGVEQIVVFVWHDHGRHFEHG